jgi:anaerobic selenocysteine-containing dehydrogenase
VAAAARPDAREKLGCATGPALREEMARVIPIYAGVEKLQKSGDAFQYGGPHLCAGGVCATPDGRGRFVPVALPDTRREPGVFHVSTRRGKQFNTLVYADVDPLNDAPRDAVLMNADDAAARHLRTGDRVELVNATGRLACSVLIAPIAPGNLQVHWPEGNVIIRRGIYDAGGKVPDYNALVRVEHAAAAVPTDVVV